MPKVQKMCGEKIVTLSGVGIGTDRNNFINRKLSVVGKKSNDPIQCYKIYEFIKVPKFIVKNRQVFSLSKSNSDIVCLFTIIEVIKENRLLSDGNDKTYVWVEFHKKINLKSFNTSLAVFSCLFNTYTNNVTLKCNKKNSVENHNHCSSVVGGDNDSWWYEKITAEDNCIEEIEVIIPTKIVKKSNKINVTNDDNDDNGNDDYGKMLSTIATKSSPIDLKTNVVPHAKSKCNSNSWRKEHASLFSLIHNYHFSNDKHRFIRNTHNNESLICHLCKTCKKSIYYKNRCNGCENDKICDHHRIIASRVGIKGKMNQTENTKCQKDLLIGGKQRKRLQRQMRIDEDDLNCSNKKNGGGFSKKLLPQRYIQDICSPFVTSIISTTTTQTVPAAHDMELRIDEETDISATILRQNSGKNFNMIIEKNLNDKNFNFINSSDCRSSSYRIGKTFSECLNDIGFIKKHHFQKNSPIPFTNVDDDDDDDVVNVYSCRINEEKKSKNAPFVKTHFTGKDDDVEQISKTITIRTDSDAGTVTNKKNMIQCLNCVKNRCEKYQQQLNSIMSNNCSKNSNSGHKVQRVNGDEHMFVSRSRIKYTNRIKVDQFDDDQNNNDHDHDILGVAVDGDRKQIDVIKKDQFSVTDIKLLSLTSFKLVTLLRDYLFVVLTRPIMIVNYYPFRFSFLFHITIHCHKFWLLQFTPQAITFISHHIDSGAPASASALLRWMPQITCKNFLIKIELYLKQHHDDKQMQSIGEIKLKKLSNLMKWRKYNNLQKSFNNVKTLLSDERQNRITGPSSDLVATDRANLESKRREQIQLQRINNEGAYCGWMPVPEMLALGLLTKILQTDQCLTAFRNLTFKTYNLATHHYHPRNQDSLCADEKRGKSAAQKNRASSSGHSPRKGTTDNGTQSKGAMREAFPSLPFGSPGLDRDSRDKVDRTVEQDNQIITTSSSSSSSSSSSAPSAVVVVVATTTTTSTTATTTSTINTTIINNTATTPQHHHNVINKDEVQGLTDRDSHSTISETADGNVKQTSIGATATNPVPSHPGELEELQSVLHFPEEVALRITDAEYQLFYQVPPIEYFKHVILELQGESGVPHTPPSRSSIRGLQKRFDEVCSWVAHFIVSQATQDERKAAFACLLRAALTCWNIGNFNGAMEITAGLRSIKPKTFWSSIPEKGKLPVLDFLSAALESVEYERALARGLAMPECRVIPCFKAFLSELKDIVSTGPTNITSLSSISDSSHIDVEPVICRNNLYSGGSGGSAGSIVGGTLGASGTGSGYSSATGVGGCGVEAVNRGIQTNLRSPQENRKENFNVNTSGKWSQRKVYISDYNGDDHYFTKIGSGGLINLEQIYRTQAVMDHIDHCHQHHHALCKDSAATLLDYLRLASCSPRQMAATTTYQPEIEELEEDYEVEIGNYNPVQPIVHDHGICMIPISSRHHKIDHHILQILHHGTTAVLWEPETPSDRSCYVFFRLERSCSMVTWHKPSWRRLKTQQDFNMAVNPEELVSPRLTQKQAPSAMDIEGQSPTLDEGYLDLTLVKEITMGSRNHEYDLELLAAGKRFGLTHVECCVSILYGNTLNDNRVLCLLCPPMLCRLWYVGLSWMVRGIKRQQRLADRSMFWLKEQYIQLYFEDGCCCEPLAADAIRVFGGRDWAFSGLMTATGIQPGETVDTLRREASIKFKKKRSVVNLLTQGTSSSGPPSLEMDTPKEIRTKPIDRRKERNGSSDQLWQNVKHLRAGSITYETQLDFVDFIALFRSFSLLARKDLRDLFDQLSVARRSKTTLCSEKSRSAPELCCATRQRKIAQLHVLGLLTRNSSLDLEFTEAKCAQKKIFDAIAASSILANCAGIDTSNTQVITVSTLRKYLEARQMEVKSEDEVKAIIHRHEPDPTLRAEYCLSFEGFARYMMDKDNYAFVNERVIQSTSNMERPLSHYYIASSHNTYLTGHQLKGESSVELYSQVLLTGCRCVELDCWDGDDGSPVIYHGHTFTTKIPFKSVVEAINKSAFVASPYPVILSIENHCSLMQQARMAHIFQSVFGEKLVMKFLFDADYSDEPVLPSPSQLKHRILIKNKKLIIDIPSTISNPALRSNPALKHQASQSGRTSSIISNVSGGSVTEEFSDDEYEDDDDYDNIDEKTLHNIFGSTDEKTSRYSLSSFSNVTPTRRIEMDDKPKKRSSQIARELSDIVIYVQAIKFRGLNPISPHNSVRLQQPPSATSSSASLVTVGSILKGSSGAPSSAPSSSVDSTSAGSETESQHNSFRKLLHANVNHPCYQCSSINEASTKKLCRKHPLAVIAHTQTQLMRTYPAGLRIDSSNFNPTFFWAFGIQMVALNYQTDDPPMHINTAMFEENGCCGFVCKPDVLWDQSHLMYRRFNPLEKEFDGLHSSQIVINVVSGQYVCQSNLFCSTYVEVEMLGIPVDCSKKKTKTIKKNALNPIWNDTFFYKVMFHDLAFLRFSIYDSDSNHLVSQRVIPLKCLRPGYRHVRLRTPTNQPLSMASLFVYSRVEEESLERTSDETDEFMSGQDDSIISYSGDVASGIEPSPFVGANIPLKRRMFFLMVYGVVTDEPYTILKITQESTTQEVIAQALQRANKSTLNVNDYILVEEVRRGWEKKDRDLPSTQRVLDMFEKPLQAQGLWKGEGRFIMKRIGDDPSSRAWLTSIRSVSERRSICESGDGPSSWDDADNFLVCIYNVSPDIPYAILKVPIGSTAQDVLAQSLIKARRLENPSNFVLVEELEYGGGGSSTATNLQQRSLSDDENVYLTQSNWKTIGRFILQEKSQATPSMRRHRLAIDKISRGFSISRAAVLSSTNKPPIQVALSDPTTSRSKIKTEEPGHSQMMGRGIFRAKGNSEKETPTCSPRQRQREVHSEGETLSDDEIKETDLFSTVSRLKKMSIRKLKAWKT